MEFLWNNMGATPEPRRSASSATRPGQRPDKAYPPDLQQVPCANPSANLGWVSGLNGQTAWQRITHRMTLPTND
jgi:hypothetical protein